MQQKNFPLFTMPWEIHLVDIMQSFSNEIILNNQKFAIPHFYYDVGDLKVVTFEKPLSEQKEVSIICGGGMNIFIFHSHFICNDSGISILSHHSGVQTSVV